MQKYNILITASLSDFKLDTKIIGLINNGQINSIYLVRKTPLNSSKKIVNINPPKIIKASTVLYELWRLYTLVKISKKYSVHSIIGIQLIGHGFSAALAGIIIQSKVIVCPIGKDIHLHLHNSIYSFLVKWTIKNANKIAYMGPKSRELLEEVGISRKRLIEIKNYLDPKTFEFQKPHNQKTWDLIYVGQLIKRKNIDLLIKSVRKLKLDFPNISLAIIGTGPLYEDLFTLSNSLDLNSNIHFLGQKSNISELLKMSRAFILISEIEALPAAALEALHCGIPSILTEVCDIPGIFQNNCNCILIPPNNQVSLISAISRLLNDSELYKILNEGCYHSRNLYQNNWNIDKQTHTWNKLLEIS